MATRIYLPSSGAAAVSPAFSANWDDTADATRLRSVFDTPSGTTMTTTAYRDNSNKNENHLIHQWVSDSISAQTISAQTIKFQMRSEENSNANNNQFNTIGIRVVSSDGATVRGTILAITRDDVEMASGGTLTNRQFSATSSSVTAQANDRIVIEIGTGGDPSAGNNHNVDIRIGDNGGSDLPENDTSTSDLNPWVEFVSNFFGSSSASASGSASLSPSASASASPSAGYQGYTRGDEAALPAADADLETVYTGGEITNIGTSNDTRVAQTATGQFAIHQFKDFSIGETAVTLTWEGQTDFAPATSTVFLQIYNYNTTTWDTVDSDNTTAIDTDFTLTGIVTPLTNYHSPGNFITCRVYQESI